VFSDCCLETSKDTIERTDETDLRPGIPFRKGKCTVS
jgi:hypothetical protein